MTDSMQALAGSMAGDISRLTSISQNLANATTTSYKREIALGKMFEQRLLDAVGTAMNRPKSERSTAVDHRHGTLRQTGSPLDFAIDGDGFFEVQTEAGAAYTRRGDFQLDAAGRLATQTGHAVQGVGGPLQLNGVNPTVDRDGRVLEGEKQIGQLKIVRFANPSQLTRAAGGLFHAVEAPLLPLDGATKIRQGHLEASNVNTAAEMVKLIETMRHFEATQKVVQGVDEMMERALRKLGEF